MICNGNKFLNNDNYNYNIVPCPIKTPTKSTNNNEILSNIKMFLIYRFLSKHLSNFWMPYIVIFEGTYKKDDVTKLLDNIKMFMREPSFPILRIR
jgi:hypothetical protein